MPVVLLVVVLVVPGWRRLLWGPTWCVRLVRSGRVCLVVRLVRVCLVVWVLVRVVLVVRGWWLVRLLVVPMWPVGRRLVVSVGRWFLVVPILRWLIPMVMVLRIRI